MTIERVKKPETEREHPLIDCFIEYSETKISCSYEEKKHRSPFYIESSKSSITDEIFSIGLRIMICN